MGRRSPETTRLTETFGLCDTFLSVVSGLGGDRGIAAENESKYKQYANVV